DEGWTSGLRLRAALSRVATIYSGQSPSRLLLQQLVDPLVRNAQQHAEVPDRATTGELKRLLGQAQGPFLTALGYLSRRPDMRDARATPRVPRVEWLSEGGGPESGRYPPIQPYQAARTTLHTERGHLRHPALTLPANHDDHGTSQLPHQCCLSHTAVYRHGCL